MHLPSSASISMQLSGTALWCLLNAAFCVQIFEDMIRYFPRVQRSDISIRQIDSHDHILSAFDRSIAAYATDHFRRSGIDLILNCRVSTCACIAFFSTSGHEGSAHGSLLAALLSLKGQEHTKAVYSMRAELEQY